MPISEVKTAAAYIRVSDERQDEYSPDSQLKKIRDYCKSNGYILPEEYVFYDDGISGRSTKKRDQFRQLIGLAKEKDHPIDAILVWKFSRFARNQEESIVYKSALQKIGVEVISISEPLPEGPFGSLIERFIEWMDEYYSINLSGEVRRGMTEKVLRGEPICAPAFGYDIRDKKYYPNADADIVREIFASYLSGEGMRAIAQRLGNRGVRTKYGNRPENRWIDYILHNTVYIGKIRWCTDGNAVSRGDYNNPNIIETAGHHEPIIDMDTWERTQALLAENAIRYAKHARREQPPADYAFRSLFRCSACGATLIRISTLAPSLQCHNYSHGKCVRSHSITIRRAEKALVESLEYCAANQMFTVASSPDARQNVDTSDTEKQISAEKRRLQRAQEAYQSGIDTLEEYAAIKKKITSRIAELESTLSSSRPSPSRQAKDYAAQIKDILVLLRDPNADEGVKNTALLELLEKVVYHADSKSIDVFFRP